MSTEQKLQEIGYELDPERDVRADVINKVTSAGGLIYVSGHGPRKRGGEMAYTGRIGAELTFEQGYEAARLCIVDCLASVKAALGSLDNVQEIVCIRAYISSSPDFFDQPKILNGASELLIALFGNSGRHARTVIGTSTLPGNIAIEIDMIVKASPR